MSEDLLACLGSTFFLEMKNCLDCGSSLDSIAVSLVAK